MFPLRNPHPISTQSHNYLHSYTFIHLHTFHSKIYQNCKLSRIRIKMPVAYHSQFRTLIALHFSPIPAVLAHTLPTLKLPAVLRSLSSALIGEPPSARSFNPPITPYTQSSGPISPPPIAAYPSTPIKP